MNKRLIALCLLFAILASSMTTLVAARASYQIDSYNVTVSDQGGGKVRVTAHVGGTHSNMTEIGMPTIVLFEKVNGVWKSVQVVNSQYNYNAGSCGYQFTYQGVVGRSYYACSSFIAVDSRGADDRECNSNEVTTK